MSAANSLQSSSFKQVNQPQLRALETIIQFQTAEDRCSSWDVKPSSPVSNKNRCLAALNVSNSTASHQTVLESPVLLPMLPTEPSSTTGIAFPLPLFRGHNAPRAIHCRSGSNNTPDLVKEGGGGTPEAKKARRESSANVDGYQWKKYGEKNLKCSDAPRSYYKCSVPGCSAKKYVEYDLRTGLVSQTVIKGEHTHGKVSHIQHEEGSPTVARHRKKHPSFETDISPDSCDGLLSIMEAAKLASDLLLNNDLRASKSEETAEGRGNAGDEVQERMALGRASSSANKDEETRWKRKSPSSQDTTEEDAGRKRKSASSLDESGEEDLDTEDGYRVQEESDRKVVFVETEGENVEDSYKWRKYGRKQVKHNTFPRNYYRCTTEGCPVKKHVERYSKDPRKLMVCYEYLPHSHEAPTGSEVLPPRPTRRNSMTSSDFTRAGSITTRRQVAEASRRRVPEEEERVPRPLASQYLPPPTFHVRSRPEVPHHHDGGYNSHSPHRIDLLASVVAQQEDYDGLNSLT